MSESLTSVMAALAADAELREKVMAATTPDERAALLSAAGIAVPTAEEIEAAKLAGIAGGPRHHPPLVLTRNPVPRSPRPADPDRHLHPTSGVRPTPIAAGGVMTPLPDRFTAIMTAQGQWCLVG